MRVQVIALLLLSFITTYACTSSITPSETVREERKAYETAKEVVADANVVEEIQEATPEKMMEQTPDDGVRIPTVTVAISQRLCLSNPEVHGSDTLVRSQLHWMGQKLKEAGVKWLRYQLFWHRIEPKRGTFDFSRYDRAVDIMATYGIRLVAVLAYGNPWASSKTTTDPYFPPDDPADFAAFAKATVKHYKGRITRWEVWNEPNAGYRFWKTRPHGDPKEYATLLFAAAKAIKEVDPTSQVAFGGPFFHEQVIMGAIPFIKGAFEAEPALSNILDRLTVHPYPHYPPVDEPEDGRETRVPIWKMLSDTSQFLPGQPLWITEMGWPSYYKVDTKKQAEFLSRSFLLSFASGAELACWYKFGDSDGKALFPAENLFGLFEVSSDYKKKPPAPKPAYLALKAIHSLFGSATSVEDLRTSLKLKQGEFGYKLASADQYGVALWRQSSTTSRTITLSLPAGKQADVYDMMGKKQNTSPHQQKVDLTVGTSPTYVVVK